MALKDTIVSLATGIDPKALTYKNDTKNRPMATSRNIGVIQEGVPVPGLAGKVGRMQATFCVNYLNIVSAEEYEVKAESREASELETLKALLAKYGNPDQE